MYSVLGDKSIHLSMLDIFEKTYVSHDQASNILDLVLSYLSKCQEFATSPHYASKFEDYERQIQVIGEKWRKIQEEVHFINKDAFEIMEIFSAAPSHQHKYGFCFSQLKFDFNQKEASQLAIVVK